jgi:cytochrome c-type biogenesis protein CcmH
MRRWKNSLLILLVAVIALAQTDSAVAVLTPAVKRVGARLACLCGSCKNSVADCAMLHCHYSGPAREKIAKMLAQGMTDDQIVDSFVKEQGLRALVVPPAEGFNIMAWVMPFAMIAIGLWAIWLFIRRFRKPATVPDLDPAVLDRYRDRIEKDLSKLE